MGLKISCKLTNLVATITLNLCNFNLIHQLPTWFIIIIIIIIITVNDINKSYLI
jgi:hypothetical protein